MGNITDELNKKFSVVGSNIAEAISLASSMHSNNIAEAIAGLNISSGSSDEYPLENDLADSDWTIFEFTNYFTERYNNGAFFSGQPIDFIDDSDFAEFYNTLITTSPAANALNSFNFSSDALKKMVANTVLFRYAEEFSNEQWFMQYGVVNNRLQQDIPLEFFAENTNGFFTIDLGDGLGPKKWTFLTIMFAPNDETVTTNSPIGGWWRSLNRSSTFSRKTMFTENNLIHETRTGEEGTLENYIFLIPICLEQNSTDSRDNGFTYHEYEMTMNNTHKPSVIRVGTYTTNTER